MKLDLTFALKLQTDDKKAETRKDNHVGATSVQSLPIGHRRKGSGKRKAKPPSLIKSILGAIGWIPSNVLATLFTAVLATVLKASPK